MTQLLPPLGPFIEDKQVRCKATGEVFTARLITMGSRINCSLDLGYRSSRQIQIQQEDFVLVSPGANKLIIVDERTLNSEYEVLDM